MPDWLIVLLAVLGGALIMVVIVNLWLIWCASSIGDCYKQDDDWWPL